MDEDKRTAIAKRFTFFREHIRISLGEVSNIIGIKSWTLEGVENGEKDIDMHMYRALYDNFGVSTDWLMTGKGNMFVEIKEYTPIDAFIAAIFSDYRDHHFKTIANMVFYMNTFPGCKDFILKQYEIFKKKKGFHNSGKENSDTVKNKE